MKTTGFKELQKKLDNMSDGLKSVANQNQIPIADLLTKAFLVKHTNYADTQELFDKSGFKINSPEDFKAIPDEEWDKYIASVSKFDSWTAMLESATADYVKQKMGLN